MNEDPRERCRRAGLSYVETSELCLRRKRCGKGFAYTGPDGKTVREKATKERIKQLAIPPAWSEVCIADDPKAHIQAIGRDAEGRLQYRYHPDWDELRAANKAGRLMRLGSALPKLRRSVASALKAPGLTRKKMVAAAVRLIDRALLRPGHEEYARKDGGRGATTLLKSDVTVQGDTVIIEFTGKGGKEVRREVKDRLLAGVVKKLTGLHGRRLFSVPDETGGERPITAREVNAFLAETSGEPISAKDFRTFRASAKALAMLTEHNGDESERLRKKAIVEAADAASEILANTRTVARSSYIHPVVIKAYEAGKLETSLLRGRLRNGLTKVETALMRFLEKRQKSASL